MHFFLKTAHGKINVYLLQKSQYLGKMSYFCDHYVQFFTLYKSTEYKINSRFFQLILFH